ncbi:serine/threonine protein kinase [Synechococcus sp. PCC 7502]|uniref:serine/threonine-protein kinase n=1 Tax=Synechococcus sp. PCC 7502 TaxID=1173263 RepID=UPI00029FC852|nr:serine/threonine-protein kinase [Synechococcus sp. PCC 7502]AFY73009.1 serine/threonine protein kinase [Synechococcus sp. PCC 7502]
MTAKVLDGRYKLIKALGSGGFGRTYIARDMRRPGTPTCVVKHLQPASNDPDFVREARRLFNSEAETLEKLGKHDQIPQLLAYFEEEEQFYLVQEYIEGRSLQEEIINKGNGTEKKLTEHEVIAILRDVLNILDFVHSEGVIHRDLKPDNIIRRAKDSKLVLIDFGAVKAIQDVSTQLDTNSSSNGESRFTVTIGTPGYMPSEQSMGRPNFTSDIYALGMIAIHALTGLDPMEIPSDPLTGELIWRERAKVTNLSGTLCEEIKISNGLAIVLTRMVRYQSAQRYQSAKEVLQALSAFVISNEPQTQKILVGTANPSTRVVKTERRSAETSLGLLIGGLFVVGASTILYLHSLSKPDKPIIVSPVPTIAPNNTANTPTPVSTPELNPVAPATFSQSLDVQVGQQLNQEGSLKPNQVLNYIFAGQEGQKLTTSISGEGLTITVLAPNGAPVNAGSVGVTNWDGTLIYTGNYQIQVKLNPNTPVVKAPDPNEGVKYNLSVYIAQDIPRVIDLPPSAPPSN